MKTTRILWSGLTGKIGRAAFEAAREDNAVAIVAGMSRWGLDGTNLNVGGVLMDGVRWYQYSQAIFSPDEFEDVDIFVDYSNQAQSETMVRLAELFRKPLLMGTPGLNDSQVKELKRYTSIIPIFYDDVCCIKVKKFIDEAVQLAMRKDGRLDLYETFYQGKQLPSGVAKVIQRKVLEATGRTVIVHSSDRFDRNNLICDWEFQVHQDTSSTNIDQEKLGYRMVGFDELAHDALEIAKVMARKPVKKGEFYTLGDLWDGLVSWAI